MSAPSILELTTDQYCDLTVLRPAVRRHEHELHEKTREFVRIGHIFNHLQDSGAHGDARYFDFIHVHFNWCERHTRRYLAAGLIEEKLVVGRSIALARLAAIGPCEPWCHPTLISAATQGADAADLHKAGQSAKLHFERCGDQGAACAHALDVAMGRAVPLWLLKDPKDKRKPPQSAKPAAILRLEKSIGALIDLVKKLQDRSFDKADTATLVKMVSRLLLGLAALCETTPQDLAQDPRRYSREDPARTSRPNPEETTPDAHLSDETSRTPAPPAQAPQTPPHPSPPPSPAAAAPEPPPAPAPEPPQAPPDPDAPMITTLKALNHPTRAHLGEQLYLLMTDLPITPPLLQIERLPALCEEQGVPLPSDAYKAWLERLSAWDQGKRGLFLLPFFIKARLPGWRDHLSLLLASRMPEPLRRRAWAAYIKYPAMIPITWEDILQHYGPHADGTIPKWDGPIPERRWPSDED